jgi:hypothetical protein
MIPSAKPRPAHETLFLEMSNQEYHQWRHHPVTAAYLLYLDDIIKSFRESSADLLEAGRLIPQADEIRGRLLTLRELHSLDLGDICNFYRQEDKEEKDAGSPHQRD